MSYIARHGLSEVLLNELVDDIKASIGTFTLLLDETTTQVKKQRDFLYVTGAKVKTVLAQDI